MPIRPEHRVEIESLPPALRALVEAEVAAGNEIVEVGGGFPAPPVGCCVKLAGPVRSRPRASSEGIDFYERNSSLYSGEFADPKRWFFVLEPPRPEPPEPDMHATGAAANLNSAAAPAAPLAVPAAMPSSESATPATAGSLVERFRRSMTMDHEKFHDGVGYDLDLIPQASVAERKEIERLLVSRGVRDWMDVEALAALDTPGARAALQDAVRDGDDRISMAVMQRAPGLVAADQRTTALVSALENAELYGGLSQALSEAEDHHPPAVIDALLRGALLREGEVATHFAALLMFLHGKAEEPFDWSLRPFFLQLNTDDRDERRRWFRELCVRIDLDPDELIARIEGQDR